MELVKLQLTCPVDWQIIQSVDKFANFGSKGSNRPPGGCVRYSAQEPGNACFGVPAPQSAVADVAARRSATYLNLELVDGLTPCVSS